MTLRGYHVVEELAQTLESMRAHLETSQSHCRDMTLRENDLQSLKRYADSARHFEIYPDEHGRLHWKGYALKSGSASQPSFKEGYQK